MAVRKALTVVNGRKQEIAPTDQPAGYLPRQWFATGTYFSIALNSSSFGTFTPNINTLRAVPFFLLRPTTISTVLTEVTTLLAGSQYRVGWYSDNGSRYPGSLVAGSDALFSGASIGVKTVTYASAITLQPGLYWQVSINQLGGVVYRSTPVSALSSLLGMAVTMGSNSTISCLSSTLTFGSLPATFPAGATTTTNIQAVFALYLVT